MTAKEYLSQYRILDARIDTRFERLLRLRALAERCTMTYGHRVGSGAAVDKRAELVAKIVDAESALNAQIDYLLTLKDEIESAIASVPDNRYRALLEMRYLAGKRWEDIAAAMHYDERWVRKMHGWALLAIKSPEKPGLDVL